MTPATFSGLSRITPPMSNNRKVTGYPVAPLFRVLLMCDQTHIWSRQRNDGACIFRSSIILTLGPVIADDTDALDAPAVCVEDLELEARDGPDDLTLGRDTAKREEDEPAQCIDFFQMFPHVEIRADGIGKFGKLRAGIGNKHIGGKARKHRLILVVLVIDVTDDHLNDVFVADETVGATVLIDDESELRSLRLHGFQEIRGKHGRRCEEDLAHETRIGNRFFEINPRQIEIGTRRTGRLHFRVGDAARSSPTLVACLLGDVGQEVADMDHALGVIQRLVIDGHAGAPGFLEEDQRIADRHILVQTVDIDPWDHDIFNADFPEAEDVVQHRPFFGREGRTDFGVVHQRVGQILAQAFALGWFQQPRDA
ncbi:hypothetical protein AT6N2_C2184 [Agrobacterium tumefaciens]|nr:hypothetical protein AT6N2_C2184 [Agrobacterium tumefaciens]